jgi:NAD(P)-dependent dehydrogenase (short-subunit alcohol dehydrogenase family)
METTEEIWDQVLDVNLKGMYLTCKAIVPQMIAKGKGVILNTGSSLSHSGIPELFAYSVSKGGVNTLTRNLASALSTHRIRVNCVNPGWVLTEYETAQRAAIGLGQEWIEEQGKSVPLGRMQTGKDTAMTALFLVSDLASQITGQIINVDGGTSVINWHDNRRGSRGA